MFAVILQRDTQVGIKQVAVIPTPYGISFYEKRTKGARGVVGAWDKVDVVDTSGRAVGKPASVRLTTGDFTVLGNREWPKGILQKLCREVEYVNTPGGEDFVDQFNEVLHRADSAQYLLSQYEGINDADNIAPVAIAPVIQVVHQPEPALVTHEAHHSAWSDNTTYVYQPDEQVVLARAPEVQVTAESEEPSMFNSYTSIVAPEHESDTVLTVPDKQPYITRKFDGLDETFIYDVARREQRNVLLTGDAGTGKTSSARNYAAERGLPFVTIECTQQITDSVTQGRFVPTGVGNSTKWKYSQLATAIQRPSVILINELTRMTPKAASLFLRLLEERELLIEPLNEVIKVHPDVLFIADQNTGLGYTGTTKQDAALVDRFADKLEFHYDTAIEAKFIPSSSLLTFASSIREASDLNDEYTTPMSTRILKNFVAQARSLNFAFAVTSLLANFTKMDGEREAVKMRFDADYEAIASELGVPVGSYSTN
jgi:MoxR-like ATPase